MDGCPILPPCAQDDQFLAKWTSIRYLVLGSYMSYNFLKLSTKATQLYKNAPRQPDSKDAFVGHHPFEEHPQMSIELAKATWLPTRFFLAGCLFIQSEGVGLAVYFGVSALMDNFTIFLVKFCYCKYVTSVALYTMSLLSFLPTAAFAYYFQHQWYEGKPWNPVLSERYHKSKLFFIATMILITMLFFILRLKFIEATGWDANVDGLLDIVGPYKVSFAICVPPLIDLVQSFMLVMAATLQAHTPRRVKPALPITAGQPGTPSISKPLLGTQANEDQAANIKTSDTESQTPKRFAGA